MASENDKNNINIDDIKGKKEGTPSSGSTPSSKKEKPAKKHLIKTVWLRRTLKTLMWMVIAVLLLPVLLYIPPIQTFVKNIACNVVKKSTGMDVSIDAFRLKFPVKVSLEGVTVLDQHGDTMVRAREALVDVRPLPLLKLDVRLKKLLLRQGYYRMVSADSSMVMKIRAGLLEADDKSYADIGKSEIALNRALLRDGDVQLYMNVWKKKPVPEDTVKSTPFLIRANDIRLENFTFGMSMLPTIDTLRLKSKNVALKGGVIDLRKNSIGWKLAAMSDGEATYLTPTPEYIAAHPAPPSEPSSGPPMVIKGDSLSLEGFKALYAVKGAKPLPGFDASYISVSDVTLAMKDFYNESSTVRLPLTKIEARERSGLQITQGKGLVSVDSMGLGLDNLNITTVYSRLSATARVPFAMMELKPSSPMNVSAKALLGLPDIEAFMPAVKEYTSKMPARNPLDLALEANGSLARLEIPVLNVALRDIITLKANGYAENPLDIKKMLAHVDFDGELSDPRVIDSFTGQSGISVPAFTISGEAGADRENYSADFRLLSEAGDVAAKGHVSLNSENYNIDAGLTGVDVARFAPTAGIGRVSADVKMKGAGFNPLSGNAVTYAEILVKSIEYNRIPLSDIRATINLDHAGNLELYAVSANRGLDFDIEGNGRILHDDYTFDISARLRDLDLKALGLSKTMNSGKGNIYLAGTASPARWLYDADLRLADFDWNLENSYIHLPDGLTAHLTATENATAATVDSRLTTLSFNSPSGLKPIVDAFSGVAAELTRQIEARNLAFDELSKGMPVFHLGLTASGRGLVNQFLVPQGMSIDTLFVNFDKDSIFHGDMGVRRFVSQSLKIDTVNVALKERRNLLDYRVHVGNRPGTLDEFASVNLNGYLGENRFGAFLRQQNIKGETGYRLGLTAAMQDSTLTMHFTPLKSTIAYMPWKLNDDNFIDYNFHTRIIQADLQASSSESSILVRTEPYKDGRNELHLRLDNIRIHDFLNMWALAPPVAGSVNSDIRVFYDGQAFYGKGDLGVRDLTYDKSRLGDFDMNLKAGVRFDGTTGVMADMKVNGIPALSAFVGLRTDSAGITPDSIGLSLTKFPLKIANPFLNNMVVLGGALSGDMTLEKSFSRPVLNGFITFDSVTARLPIAASTLTFDNDPVKVENSLIKFEKFDITGVNSNPLTIDGTIDLSTLTDIRMNLGMNAKNCQLIGNDRRAKSDIYGKLFVDLDGTVKGSLTRMDVKANLNILGKTDLTYNLGTPPAEMTGRTETDVVKFVNFNDTTQVSKADSVIQTMAMRIRAGLTISPGTKATVLLSTNGTDRVELHPTAQLNYFQNYMGDMRLNGTLTIGNGFARYNVPVMGEKMFTFDPNSNVTWNGNLMNPTLDVTATDNLKANVTSDGNSRLVNFLITLRATNNLDNPKVSLNLSTDDDISIQNELQSMSADQRQTQAMNLLLYGQYTGQNAKGNANLGGNMLYSFLESQLNSWAAKNIRGVNLSFGIDQYDRMTNGASSTETSYSYQVSKSLFNNRFKIQVGGNYSTDASADENLSQNLISDVSFEYILKQTPTLNMSVKIFRHTGYESILEGEITETGAGFVMKRKLQNLLHLFRIRKSSRRRELQEIQEADSVRAAVTDSVKALNEVNEVNEDEKN